MTKKILSTLFALGISVYTYADKTVLINGSKAEKSDVSEISFAGDNLELKYADGNSFKLDIEAIEINFSDVTSTGGVLTNTFTLNTLVEDKINLTNIEEGTLVQIFRVDGRVIYTAIANSGEMTIFVGGLTPAPYLIKVGNQIVKFIKK